MARRPKLDPGITMMGNKFRVRIFAYGRQWHVGNFDTIQGARAALHAERDASKLDDWIPPAERRRRKARDLAAGKLETVTVDQWADTWIARQETEINPSTGRPITPGTIATRRSLLNVHIRPVIGHMPIADVTANDVDKVVNRARRRPSTSRTASRNNSIRSLISCMRTMFAVAVEERVNGMTVSPVSIKPPPKPRAKGTSASDFASPSEVARLANAMPDDLRIVPFLATYCQLRIGELLGLQRGDFTGLDTPSQARLSIVRQWNSKSRPPAYTGPKAGSVRTIELPAALVPMVLDHLDRFVKADDDAPLFAGTTPGRPMSHNSLATRWNKAREVIGRPDLKFHDLRRTGRTLYARAGNRVGMSDADLMARGGHSDMSTAQIYQRAARAVDRRIADEMVIDLDGDATK